MDTHFRPSGVEGLGDMSWGTHFCLFYETKEDLVDIFLPFIRTGLEHQQFCLCGASDPLIFEEVDRALRQALPGFERYLAAGQIEIILSSEWYLKDGRFDGDRVLQGWLEKLDQALAKGFSGLRFAVSLFLEKKDWLSFSRYEEHLEEALRDVKIEGLCAYNLNRQSAANVLDIIRHHQFTLARRDGIWESLEGIQLKRSHEEVLKLNVELEQRVAERTATLTSINEQLRAEIIERKRVEEALRESEEKFSAAFRASPIALVIATMDGRYIEMNQAFCDLLGYSREELLGKTAVEVGIFDAESRQEWNKAVTRQGGVVTNVELNFRVRNGIFRTTLSSVETITIQGIPHRLSTVLDITERKLAEEAVRRSERNFRALADKSLQGITIFQDQKIVYANPAQSALLGYTIEELKSMSVEQIIALTHPLDRSLAEERARQRIAGEELSPFVELRILRKDGAARWIQSFNSLIEYNGKPAVLTATIDVTERKQAEGEIRRYAARMEALARISQSLTEVGLDVQAVFETLVKYTAEVIGDLCLIRLLSDDELSLQLVAFHHHNPKAMALMESIHRQTPLSTRISPWVAQVLETGQGMLSPTINQEQLRQVIEPGQLPYIEEVGIYSFLVVPLRVQNRVAGTLGLTRDKAGHPYTPEDQAFLQELADRAALVIQNAQLFSQVEGSRERLESLSRRLLEVQEAERRALTNELHDRVGQNLTGLSINLQNMKALLSDKVAKSLTANFDDAQALVEDTARQIRDIMAELHLPELEDYGLAAALETYAERVASRGNLKLVANLPDLADPSLTSEVRIALFRAAQEAMSNILKHAKATKLEISLEERNGKIHLRIEDNGRGFETDTALQKGVETWGLKIMRERIESIGGTVQLESEPGRGTQVTFEVKRPS